MDMVKIGITGIVGVLLAIQIKAAKPEFHTYISIAATLLIFFFALTKLELVVGAIRKIEGYLSIPETYMVTLFKIIGITYIAEFSSNICKDAGYQSISNQIEIFGKLSILAVSMPVLLALLDTINGFLA